MFNLKPSLSDIIINYYIKNYIVVNNLTDKTLYKLLRNKFSKNDIHKIKNCSFIFDIEEFIYLTKKLNLDIDILFKQIQHTIKDYNK